MKKINKFVISIGFFLFLFFFICTTANAKSTGTFDENTTWELSGNTMIISGTGAITSSISGDLDALSSADKLDIIVQEGVTSIENLWYPCSQIRSIYIPESVTSISHNAFANCENLTSVIIHCKNLAIDDYAFDNCSSLANITISGGELRIGNYAFANCKNLTACSISSSIEYLGVGIFERCQKLTGFSFPANITYIPDNMFSQCESLQNIFIPDSLTHIGNFAFSNCSHLNNIEIPDNVKTLGNSVFSCCYNLKTITLPEQMTSIGDSAFGDCNKLQRIQIPNGLTKIKPSTFHGCHKLQQIIIPDGITTIEHHAFSECFNLTEVTIPNTVINIGANAFEDSYSLKNVEIPSNVQTIGKYAFGFYTVGIGPQNINQDSLSQPLKTNKKKVKRFTIIGKRKTSAYKYAKKHGFKFIISAKKGKTYVVGSFKYKILNSSEVAFAGLTKKKTGKISIPNKVLIRGKKYKITCIVSNALKGSRISGIVIGKNITKIEKNAFKNCRQLKTITIRSSKLYYVGSNALKGIRSTAVIKVPVSQLTNYKKLFSNKGQHKHVKIKK